MLRPPWGLQAQAVTSVRAGTPSQAAGPAAWLLGGFVSETAHTAELGRSRLAGCSCQVRAPNKLPARLQAVGGVGVGSSSTLQCGDGAAPESWRGVGNGAPTRQAAKRCDAGAHARSRCLIARAAHLIVQPPVHHCRRLGALVPPDDARACNAAWQVHAVRKCRELVVLHAPRAERQHSLRCCFGVHCWHGMVWMAGQGEMPAPSMLVPPRAPPVPPSERQVGAAPRHGACGCLRPVPYTALSLKRSLPAAGGARTQGISAHPKTWNLRQTPRGIVASAMRSQRGLGMRRVFLAALSECDAAWPSRAVSGLLLHRCRLSIFP